MQNKANLLDAQMNVSSVLTKYYENKPLCRRGENKPNQTQSPFLPPLIKSLLYRLDPLLQVFNFLMLDEVVDNVFGRQTLEAFIAIVQQAGQCLHRLQEPSPSMPTDLYRQAFTAIERHNTIHAE